MTDGIRGNECLIKLIDEWENERESCVIDGNMKREK